MEDGRWSFSVDDYIGEVVVWSDPSINDVSLVRVVLGPWAGQEGQRELTTEEQADYWYWKARGK